MRRPEAYWPDGARGSLLALVRRQGSAPGHAPAAAPLRIVVGDATTTLLRRGGRNHDKRRPRQRAWRVRVTQSAPAAATPLRIVVGDATTTLLRRGGRNHDKRRSRQRVRSVYGRGQRCPQPPPASAPAIRGKLAKCLP